MEEFKRDRYFGDKTVADITEKATRMINDKRTGSLIIRFKNGVIQYAETTNK